ncbi:IPT/TIG domain-containing protein [Sphingobacterium anhuiense]|uniref:IPT/TIG domain-containing protein n=1 Tax=Sphingobacterium anhuiense TaxID=493780 RepID=UPI003C2CA155
MYFKFTNSILRMALPYSLLIFTISFFLLSCSKEEKITMIDTTPISIEIDGYKNLKKDEITFLGKVTYLNDEKIIDFGWIIQERLFDESGKEKVVETTISMGKDPKVGTVEFHYKPKKKFGFNQDYSYFLYLKTEENVYRSESNSFVFNGLVIKTEETLKATFGDQVTIEGDFSMINSDFQLQIDNFTTTSIPYEVKKNGTILNFQFPKNPGNIFSGEELNITLNKVDRSKTYRAIIGKIKVIATAEVSAKLSYKFSESIDFTSNDYSPSNPRNGYLKLLIGDNIIDFTNNVYFRHLKKVSPTMRIGYINDRDTIIFKDVVTFELPDQKLINFSSIAVHPHSDFKLTGVNFGQYFTNLNPIALFDNKYQISYHENNNSFVVPDIPDGTYSLTLRYPIGTLNIPKNIEVRKLKWTSLSTINPHYGETVTIKGNFIKGQEYRILTPENQDQATVVAEKENQLEVVISPRSFSSGEWKIGYRDQDYNFTYNDKSQFVTIKSPVLTSASPLRGRIGQVITLKGAGISYVNRVMLGDMDVYRTEINNNEIQITVPSYAPKGKMRLSIITKDQINTLPELFEVY